MSASSGREGAFWRPGTGPVPDLRVKGDRFGLPVRRPEVLRLRSETSCLCLARPRPKRGPKRGERGLAEDRGKCERLAKAIVTAVLGGARRVSVPSRKTSLSGDRFWPRGGGQHQPEP